MKRRLLNAAAFSGLVLLMTCSRVVLPPPVTPPGGGSLVLHAQSAPAIVHALWNVNPPDQNITEYHVQLDGVQAVALPAPACADGVCRTPVTIPTFGQHIVAVCAVNINLSGDPGVVGIPTCGPPSRINFTLAPSPTAVSGLSLGTE